MTKHSILKEYFGYDTFRPLQEEIIDQLIDKKDTLVLMPTGGGKSICYQVPAMLLDGLTVVISPLIALMKDQVEALRANGIKASFLNSSISSVEQDAVMWAAKLGELKLLYIAPEKLFSGNTMTFFKELKISLFAIDESHCISSWGHDFRPEYRQLSIIKTEFPEVPIVALTATADKITRKDICKQLGIAEENTFISSFDRPNLSLEVLPGRKRMQQIQDFLSTDTNQSGIIYCLSRKTTESVAANLQAMGLNAAYYHAGIPSEKRSKVQENFINDDVKIIVATIAFGMGIDKSNVRWVIHYNMPSNVESFYQEIGRAGRDGSPSKTLLFYSFADVMMRRQMIFDSDMPLEQKELMEAKLNRMQQYAEANICRRRILISYFNEDLGKDCGNCDVCKNPRKNIDATVIAQKALSAITRTREKIAMTMLVDILRGSRNQQVLRYGYDQLPTFGVGKDLRSEVWFDYILQLLNYGAFDIAYDEAHIFKLNATSMEILKGQRQVQISEYISPQQRKEQEDAKVPSTKTKKEYIKNELFEKLRVLRKEIADKLNLPPYTIFHDSSLLEMADARPIDKAQFLDISGVGQEKMRKFGDAFINEIRAYIASQSDSGIKLAKGLTHVMSFEMYKDGMTVEEIAMQRNLSPTTIVGHLVKMKENGEEVDLRALVDNWTFDEVTKAIKELDMKPTDPLKPLFEHLGEQIDYGKLRIVLALQ